MRRLWLLFVVLSGLWAGAVLPARADLKLPDPKEAMTDPAMERLAGYLFSQRYEKTGNNGQPLRLLPPDDPDSLLVSRVTASLARVVAYDRPDMQFQSRVVDSAEINAHCFPGGYVYVDRGLLNALRKWHGGKVDMDALAMIVGHEIAHAVLRHTLQRWAQSRFCDQVLDYSYLYFDVMMAFEREHESEADRYGMLYGIRAGYRPSAAAEFWESLAREGEIPPHRRTSWAGWDHPAHTSRAEALRAYRLQLEALAGLWDESLKAIANQDDDQATICLELLRADFPHLPSVHNNLGFVYFQTWQKSLPEARRGPQQLAYAYMPTLGLTLRGFDGGETQALVSAESEFQKALELNPQLASALQGGAMVAMARGDLGKAEALLAQATKVGPRSAPVLCNLGVLEERKGRQGEALESYRQAVALQPAYPPALYNLGHLLATQGHKKEAVNVLRAYLKLDSQGFWADLARNQLVSLGEMAASSSESSRAVRGAGGVVVGDGREAVDSRLGPPASKQTSRSGQEIWSYPTRGLRLFFGDSEVRRITVTSPDAGAVGGVTVGMKGEDVQHLLGAAPSTTSADQVEYWNYPSLGFAVGVRDGRVDHIVIARF